MIFDSQNLISLFNNLFKQTDNTILVGGSPEPLYLPEGLGLPFNQIIFTQDYFSSALHEVAHWCVAGKERRKLIDYGYWYNPDGRSADQQKIFEQAEIKPQAIEWIFSAAAGTTFRVSADNIADNNIVSDTFKKNIHQQVLTYLQNGLPPRAELFKQTLLSFYQRTHLFNQAMFQLQDL